MTIKPMTMINDSKTFKQFTMYDVRCTMYDVRCTMYDVRIGKVKIEDYLEYTR